MAPDNMLLGHRVLTTDPEGSMDASNSSYFIALETFLSQPEITGTIAASRIELHPTGGPQDSVFTSWRVVAQT